jgi:hypothetical protein
MKFPMRMSNLAKQAFGTMQAIKGFFSRLGKASEVRLQGLLDKFTTIAKKSGENVPRAVVEEIESLKQESEEYYAIKNFVEQMPLGLTPPQYFNLVLELLRKLGRAEEAMEPNCLYTFKYRAKTKGKYYDVFPVIMLNSIQPLHYRGFNFHWERAPEYVESVYRTYSFGGVQSRFYKIKPHELEYFLQIPTFMPIFIPL